MNSKNSNKNLLNFSQSVINIRFWEERNLPLSQSRIAFDLFVFIAKCHYSETHITLKYLFNSLSYSERGVRYVLEQFIDNGWCEVVDSASDKRFRHVVATVKLTTAFEDYESICVDSYRRLATEIACEIQSSNDDAFESPQLLAAIEDENLD